MWQASYPICILVHFAPLPTKMSGVAGGGNGPALSDAVSNPCPAAPNDIRGTIHPAVLHFAPTSS